MPCMVKGVKVVNKSNVCLSLHTCGDKSKPVGMHLLQVVNTITSKLNNNDRGIVLMDWMLTDV